MSSGRRRSRTRCPTPFVLYPSIIPAIGYNPALGFLIGIVSKAGMLLGDPGDTTMSSASLLVLLTTNKQLVLQLGSTILTAQDDWALIGDWRFLLYNQETYGLSTGTPLTSTVVLDRRMGEHHPHRRRPAHEVQPPALPPGGAPEGLGQPLPRRRHPHRPLLRHRGRVARPGGAVAGRHEPLRLQHATTASTRASTRCPASP